MDTLTQMALGATVAQAGFHARLGPRAAARLAIALAVGALRPARAKLAAEGVRYDRVRYGLPGGNERGLWGVRGVFDAEGRLVAEPTRFSIPRQVERGALAALVRAAFGRPSDRYCS